MLCVQLFVLLVTIKQLLGRSWYFERQKAEQEKKIGVELSQKQNKQTKTTNIRTKIKHTLEGYHCCFSSFAI